MRIFVYEFVTGGGFLADAEAPLPESLAGEGEAMLRAVCEDFARLDGVAVEVTRDARMAEPAVAGATVWRVGDEEAERAAFDRLAASCDATLVIAPELEGHLLARCRRAERVGGHLVGPGVGLVEVASDKQQTVACLAAAGLPVPEGVALGPSDPLPADFPYPAVLKPRWGAGSQGVRLVADASAAVGVESRGAIPLRLECFRAGTAASVAAICGPAGSVVLPPCGQRLGDDGQFTYLGGYLPLAGPAAERAEDLARRVLDALPEPRGYLGIDLVLGEDSQGGDDVVVEVNPRLTTSYVGLRRVVEPAGALAAAMLAASAGRPPEVRRTGRRVEFSAAGDVRQLGDG